MGKTSLKARDIEALTFLYTSDVRTGAGGGSRRGSWFRARPAAFGLTAALVAIAALAWIMFAAR